MTPPRQQGSARRMDDTLIRWLQYATPIVVLVGSVFFKLGDLQDQIKDVSRDVGHNK